MLYHLELRATRERSGRARHMPRICPLNHCVRQLTTVACSKEDEEVLKAEYQRNPKPDKTVRIEIASKVALGEKEVAVRVHVSHMGARITNNTHLRSGFRTNDRTIDAAPVPSSHPPRRP